MAKFKIGDHVSVRYIVTHMGGGSKTYSFTGIVFNVDRPRPYRHRRYTVISNSSYKTGTSTWWEHQLTLIEKVDDVRADGSVVKPGEPSGGTR